MNNRPNIIFFFSDQQRWDTVGCYGQKLNVTPNLDKMAAEGVKFEYAFTCQPVCGPARACLQTGKYATETGCFTNGIALRLEEKTIAKIFNEEGYETAYIGKWHLASTKGENDFSTKAIPLDRRGGYKDYWMAADVLEFTSHGYDGYVYDMYMNKVNFKGYRPNCITDFALNYLRNKKNEKPFFMFLSHIEPHHQNDRNKYEGPNESKDKFIKYEIPSDLVGTKGDWRENYPDYLGCCSSLDYNLGRIREELEKLNIADNTIIIYTSDHGSHFRTRNDEYKRSCHENSIRVPMVIYGPGFKGGQNIEEMVSLIDLPPTLLACADIKIPETMKGNPIQGLVKGITEGWPQEVFMQISESQVGRAIRTKKWKYSVRAIEKNGWQDCESSFYTEDYLYDLEKDYDEKNNLVDNAEYFEVRLELAEILKRRMEQAGERVPEILSLKLV